MTLEQQLADLIRKHGLLNISITATVSGDDVRFYGSAQAPKDGGDRWCAGNEGFGDTVAAVVDGAISMLNAKREPTIIHALSPMGVAS